MSFTSLFEETAKTADGLDLLNRLRHVLQGRDKAKLLDEEKKIIIEALTINDPKNIGAAVLYNLQGSGDTLKGTIPVIGRALHDAASCAIIDFDGIDIMKNYLVSGVVKPEETAALVRFVGVTMERLDQQRSSVVPLSPLDFKDEY